MQNQNNNSKGSIIFYLILFVFAIMFMFSFAKTAFGQEQTYKINIATGVSGGGYDKDTKIKSAMLAQSGFDVTVTNMNGSDEISKSLCLGQNNMGWVQLDVMWKRSNEGCNLTPVADYGFEYAMILFPPKSDLRDLGDLNESHTILIGTVGSGPNVTFNNMKSIELGENGSKTKWAFVNTENLPFEAAAGLANAKQIDAIFLTHKVDSKILLNLLDKGWIFGSLYDKDIDDQLYRDEPLYESLSLCIKGKKEKCNYVYKVPTVIAVNDDIANNQDFFLKMIMALN